MKALALIPLALCLGACADLSTETKVEETTWQALNVIDTVQTVQMQRQPLCYQETGEFGINGRHPSEAAIVGFQAAMGLVHFGMTELFEHTRDAQGAEWLTRTFEIASIATTWISAVHRNQNLFNGHLLPQDPGCTYKGVPE